jgi:hypothetical protein
MVQDIRGLLGIVTVATREEELSQVNIFVEAGVMLL